MLIDTLPMQARRGHISDDCKMLFKCSETSGATLTDAVNGVIYDPSDVTSGNDDGSLSFVTDNAARLVNDTSTNPVNVDLKGLTFSLSNAIILAAVVTNIGSDQTRVNLGLTATSAEAISVSLLGAGGMHIGMDVESEPLNATSGGTMVAAANTQGVLYVMWDGVDTLSGKLLNLDGTVYNDGVAFELSVTETTEFTQGQTTLTPTGACRWTNGDYYQVAAWEYDSVPDDLDFKLSQWGAEAVAGNKSAVDL